MGIIVFGEDKRPEVLNYRVAQNHGKQVLKISCMKFHLITIP